jgi:hypothetical protein
MSGRAGLIETVESLRAYALFASVPYALFWSSALVVDGREAEGTLFIVAHALGLLLVALVSDRVDTDRDGVRGLALWRFPTGDAERADDLALPILALLTLVAFVGLTLAHVWLGLSAIGLLAIALWNATRARRSKYALVEVIAPVGALLAPMALVGVFAPGEITAQAAGATVLGAAVLGLVLLLCVIRDQPLDALRGWSTTATRVGRRGAGALAWAWIVAVVLLSAMGASWGWWGWLVSAAAALGAAASGAAFARGAYERLVALWTIVFWVVSVAFMFGN